MAYDEKLANHTREIISLTHKKVEEKKMFGGLCFMVNDKMCVGVEQDRLMAVSYTHLRAHETVLDLVCRLLLEKKKKSNHSVDSTTSFEV